MAFRPEFGKGSNFISLSPERKGDTTEQAYYVRTSVRNDSRTLARNCQAYLAQIERETSPSMYEVIHQDPIPLAWSFVGAIPIDLPPKLDFHFDVFSVSNIANRITPQTKPTAVIWETSLAPHGRYRYTVTVTGENVNPVSLSIEFYWGGSFDAFPRSFEAAVADSGSTPNERGSRRRTAQQPVVGRRERVGSLGVRRYQTLPNNRIQATGNKLRSCLAPLIPRA